MLDREQLLESLEIIYFSSYLCLSSVGMIRNLKRHRRLRQRLKMSGKERRQRNTVI